MRTGEQGTAELACDINAISKPERERHDELSRELLALMSNIRRAHGGIEFDLPGTPEVLRKIAEWIPPERACCPFLDFRIEAGAESGPFTLRLSGPPGTEAFLREKLGLSDVVREDDSSEIENLPEVGDSQAQERETVRVVLGSFQAVEERDEARVREFFHPEFESHWPMSLPYGGVKRGFNASGKTWTNAWNPLQPTGAERAMTPRVVAVHGDEVVVHWRQRGIDGNGAVYDGEVLGLYQVREGKLARAQMFYFDTSAVAAFLARALGER